MEKRSIKKLLIIFFSLIFIFNGCLTNEKENKTYLEYYYELQICSKNTTEIIFPIPHNYNTNANKTNNYSKIIDILNINNGNGDIEITKNDKGMALKIFFSDNISIIGKKRIENVESREFDDFFFNELTMKNMTANNIYNIYSNKDNITIKVFICSYYSYGKYDNNRIQYWRLENNTINQGWNSVKMKGI